MGRILPACECCANIPFVIYVDIPSAETRPLLDGAWTMLFNTPDVEQIREKLTLNIAELAENLLGSPNRKRSNRRELRWGNKGGFRVCISGEKQGACADFGGDFKGGPFDLIMHINRYDFATALRWAHDWLAGLGLDSVDDATASGPSNVAAAGAVAQDAQRQQQRIAEARWFWEQGVAVAGTPADAYLTVTRGIPAPLTGWPHEVIRFLPNATALMACGTDDDGNVQFVHFIRLTPEGTKVPPDGKLIKVTKGVMTGAFVRLPGVVTGPRLLAEGLETALSLWVATGFETYAAVGSNNRHNPPLNWPSILCIDDDPTDNALIAKITEWMEAGANILVATPWPERRRDKSDFNDVLCQAGLAAVQARVVAAAPLTIDVPAPHFPRPRLAGPVAGRRLQKVIRGFFNRVERHLEAQEWIKSEIKGRAAAQQIEAIEPSEATASTSPAADDKKATKKRAAKIRRRVKAEATKRFGARAVSGHGRRVQVAGAAGLGKTRAFIHGVLESPVLRNKNILVSVRDTRLAEELEADFKQAIEKMAVADGDKVPRVIRILPRKAEGMCREQFRQPMEAALKAGLTSLYRGFCYRPDKPGEKDIRCPFYDDCRYIAQFKSDEPAIRIVTHARLSRQSPEDLQLPDADLAIVDEGVLNAVVEHIEIDPAGLINYSNYAAAPDSSDLVQEAKDIGQAVAQAFTSGRADPIAVLREAGISHKMMFEAAAAATEAAFNAEPDIRPGQPLHQVVSVCSRHVRHQGLAIAALYEALAHDLQAGRDQSTGVEFDADNTVTLPGGRSVQHPIFRVHRLAEQIVIKRKTPLLITDADAILDVNKVIFGRKIKAITIAGTRQAYVTQIHDFAITKSSLAPLPSLSQNSDYSAALKEKISLVVKREVARDGGKRALVIAPKQARLALTDETTEPLPVDTDWHGARLTHFGRHLGLNLRKGFDTVVVVGREQLPPIEAERLARAVYAQDVSVTLNLAGAYVTEKRRHDLRNGIAQPVEVQVHPDPRVQELAELPRERAMAQGIDRLRLIHRDPANPARVVIVSNLPVPGIVVDQLLSFDELAAGGTAWERAAEAAPVISLSASWLYKELPGIFKSRRTAERMVADLKPPFHNIYPYYEVAVYRPEGQRRPSRAACLPSVADFPGSLSVLLGIQLAKFSTIWPQPTQTITPLAPMFLAGPDAVALAAPSESSRPAGFASSSEQAPPPAPTPTQVADAGAEDVAMPQPTGLVILGSDPPWADDLQSRPPSARPVPPPKLAASASDWENIVLQAVSSQPAGLYKSSIIPRVRQSMPVESVDGILERLAAAGKIDKVGSGFPFLWRAVEHRPPQPPADIADGGIRSAGAA
jgi:hypothetical protein